MVRERPSGREYRQGYDALVLSPGAEPLRPRLPGIDDPRVRTLRSMEDMDAIIGTLRADAAVSALVIGAGYIGLEMAEALRQRGAPVVLVEKLPHVMGVADAEMTAPLHDELRRNGVDLRLATSVEAFEPQGDRLLARLSDGDAGRVRARDPRGGRASREPVGEGGGTGAGNDRRHPRRRADAHE